MKTITPTPAVRGAVLFVTAAAIIFVPVVGRSRSPSPPNPPVIIGITPDTGVPRDEITSAELITVDGNADPHATIKPMSQCRLAA